MSTIEEKYQKLSQREHVLLRSGMYIGSIKKQVEELWVAKETEDGFPKMEKVMVEYSPGFMKIFDEVLTNATDHSFRDSSVTTIKVEYSKETGEISVWNNGSGIPVQLHKEHNIYVPELIFGHLLSGSNYNDSTTRTGAGTNGLGSKLSNIYSKKFIVETLDSDTKKKFIQEFSDNMTQKSKPKITTNSGKSYTKITFIPEYSRFGMNGLEDDTILLIRKRVLDCIACTNNNVQVYLNGEKLRGKGLIDYTKYFFEGEKVITESHIEKIKKNGEITEYIWEYAIVPYTHFEQVSFVNGNATNQGGKHVDYILYQIINKLKKTLEDKKKLKELKPNFIKDKMFVFLRATVANPTFNSQTKEQLTTPSKDFGCSITVSDAFITKLYKSSITEEIVEFCKLKESASLSKHSVSGDTPLLLKDKNNKIIIKTIEKITDIFTETHDNNDYGKSDYKVWTEDGWTDIIHVMRHKSSKQMYRVLTHTGFVDVTEDHSLLTSEKEEISPKDCIIGDELLHSFPDFTDNKLKLNFSYKELKSIELHNYASYLKIPYYRGTKDKLISLIENKHIEYQSQHFIDLEYDNTINYEEAWVMGLFWADGTAGFYTDKHGCTIYNFAIHNTNKNFLIKTQEIFSKIYPNEKTSIYTLERDYTRQTKYQLQFNGYCKIAYIIKKYIDLFYYGKNDKTKFGNKCIPIEILNAKRNIRENFLRGVYCGDGRSHNIDNKGVKEISIESKISSQGIYYLAKSLGYFVSIQCREDKPNIFILILGKYYYNKHPNKIKKIIKLGYTNEYVYDLETKNHHFQAGIGRMIVHNTDGKKANKIYIPKLEDAIWAGTARSNQCTLILTEGDSAKTFAMWGRSIVGPEKYGVMPLKGKCVSEDTEIPLFNGEIKLAKDIQIGDILIGDDGNKRKVLTLYKGNGKMYEVFQDRGETYKVNDEHILTLCMPEHKTIYWVPSNYTWRTIYWDKDTKNIKAKESQAFIKIKCKECDIMINTKCLKRHYTRKHKNVEYVPYKLEYKDMNDISVIEARKRLEEFLLNIDDNNIIDICIQDYLNITESFKRKLKGIRGECVNWGYQEVLLDPYVLGLWLGDGCKSGYSYACDGENDYELINYLNEWGKNNDANLNHSKKFTYNFSSIQNYRKHSEAPLKKILSQYNLVNNKHIPKEYLINSKEVRLKVLAGIIDTDGYVASDGTIEISQSTKHKRLVDDIVYLSRSLGFYTYLSDKKTNYIYKKSGKRAKAYRIKISGDTKMIPTILPRKKSTSTTQYNIINSTGTITIKQIDDCDYVGIGIDKNNRFLINDFTVTHNCLNVRDASIAQLIGNEEINNLKQILGLKQDRVYKDTNDLRYGKVMLLTDSDVDGSHIKSLLVNMFHYWWPSLIKMDYIQTLKTPIVKAIKGKQIMEFYTEQDYLKWKATGINLNSYHIRYFKGLGTSKKEDAKDTFKRLEELKVDYYYKDKKCDEAILLAFDKDKNTKVSTKKTKKDKEDSESNFSNTEVIKCSDKRKNWLANYDKNLYLDVKDKKVSYQDLINKELIHFSIYDNLRSIPSLCDGLKPSQRKILYYMLSKNKKDLIKVAQLAGYVSAETAYHHGEASLQGAIINMAQDFVGSNNINLLVPDGNHGSRLQCGKDAASPRYIFTKLSDTTDIIFNPNDTPLLEFLNDDGMQIEPEWYLPIIPMILVNGCEGIGTGYSTFIPSFNPKEIIYHLTKMIDDENYTPSVLNPYFKGFHGKVQEIDKGSYVTKGKWERLSDKQIKITEIPIGTGVTNYKEFLESLIESNINNKKQNGEKSKPKKKRFELKDVQNHTKDENDDILFIVEFKNKSDLDDLIKSDTIEKELKLIKSFSTNNMYLFNEKLILTKYNTPIDILLEFFDIRIEYYVKRREYLIAKLQKELLFLQSKARFITEYIEGKLDINKRSKEHIINLLKNNNYPQDDNSYDYLLRLPIYSLTLEKINDLNTQCEKKTSELNFIKNNTPEQLWKIDLEQLLKKL